MLFFKHWQNGDTILWHKARTHNTNSIYFPRKTMYWKQWVDNLIKIACSTDIRESPDQLPPYANVTPQLNMGPRCKWPPLGLCKSCTHGKRTTKDTRRKQPTMCILWKTTRANRCSSIARRTGSKHEASPTCCWLKVSWTHSKTYTKDDSDDNIYSGSAAGKCHACQCPVHTPHGWESLSWLQPCHSTGPYLLPKVKRYLHTAHRKGVSAHS